MLQRLFLSVVPNSNNFHRKRPMYGGFALSLHPLLLLIIFVSNVFSKPEILFRYWRNVSLITMAQRTLFTFTLLLLLNRQYTGLWISFLSISVSLNFILPRWSVCTKLVPKHAFCWRAKTQRNAEITWNKWFKSLTETQNYLPGISLPSEGVFALISIRLVSMPPKTVCVNYAQRKKHWQPS